MSIGYREGYYCQQEDIAQGKLVFNTRGGVRNKPSILQYSYNHILYKRGNTDTAEPKTFNKYNNHLSTYNTFPTCLVSH